MRGEPGKEVSETPGKVLVALHIVQYVLQALDGLSLKYIIAFLVQCQTAVLAVT